MKKSLYSKPLAFQGNANQSEQQNLQVTNGCTSKICNKSENLSAKSISMQLAEFVSNTHYSDLPPDILLLTEQHFLDTIGCCLAGVSEPSAAVLTRFFQFEGGHSLVSGVGLKNRVTLSQAALYNGLLARSVEFDDMYLPDLHPSGVIVPMALAVAEFKESSGKELLASVALGLEVLIRLGLAGVDSVEKTSSYLKHGQDATAICGTVAGATIAAKLLGLGVDAIANALQIAISFASGSLEANRSGGNIKQYQSGWAAECAVRAALWASYGVSGPEAALEGEYGFYQCFIQGHFDSRVLTQNLGSEWLLREIRFKPYPANYYTHSSIDAALALKAQGLTAEQVDTVEINLARAMCRTVGEPLSAKQNPTTAYASKFSAPYAFASALMGGSGLGMGSSDYSDSLVVEPARIELMQRIQVQSNEECDKIFPRHAPAIVKVQTKHGKQFTVKILKNRGSKDNPLTDAELETKFKENATQVLSLSQVQSLYEQIKNIATHDTLSSIMQILRQANLKEGPHG